MNDYQAEIKRQLNFMDYVPSLFTSAKTGQRVDRVLGMVRQIRDERNKRVTTGELNQLVRDAVRKQPPPTGHGRILKILYATQAGVNPPTFIFFVNDPKLSHFSYNRFLENQIRDRLGFQGTPIKVVLKQRS